ncbi:hypothetical protein PHLCEN_2v12154 [Hermanssonia centrifuga]|uniref:Uncharacterized protein n=1 Tax=Hermanssonia centrifuga TaxID=98765 RepID=A0A2R6NHT4_9APHY|nr:hypothetical protein PHLCEN_2v12154 [Hermanssonia centrifuga]
MPDIGKAVSGCNIASAKSAYNHRIPTGFVEHQKHADSGLNTESTHPKPKN